ncbi:MAG: YbdD/YjiX family protein [Methylococcaceae bacterium]|nr:YbdD/YjiX family protein [Methylococcaceae bacterium]MCI0732785.1 YbdD/YjiX family protein [Methylococcaceae bacterium]
MPGRLNFLWQWLRRVSGDDAYERYIEYHARCHTNDASLPDCSPLSKAEFFKQRQEEKWNGVKRCC